MSFLISINGADLTPYDFAANGINQELASQWRKIRASSRPQRVQELDLPKDFKGSLKGSNIEKYQTQQEPTKERQKQRRINRAKDLMSTPAVSLKPSAHLTEALQVMQEKGFHHLVVVDKKKSPIGLISDRDLLRAQLSDPDLSRPVSEIMTRNLIVATPETLLYEIAWALRAHRIHCLPIILEPKELVGILTTGDILNALLKRADVELWA